MRSRIISELKGRLRTAVATSLGQEVTPEVTTTTEKQFGDYQSNVALVLAKRLGRSPRDIASHIAAALDTREIVERPIIAGPGFINFRLSLPFLAATLGARVCDARLGIEVVTKPARIVVDFSSPNVAKRMHVGHLRSTIIGDAIVRTLRFLGHSVVSDNHVGDWGTQFGMLIWAWKHLRDEDKLRIEPIGELERLYQVASERSRSNECVAEACRAELVKLQSGDEENVGLWQRFVEISRREAVRLYQRLGVAFDLWRGESYYNDMLPCLVTQLLDSGIARSSDGAAVVFFSEPKELVSTPFLIRKSDGAALYSTTDLATLKTRVEELNAERIIYVVDVRQSLHFKQLFATAALMGYAVELTHVGFGTIQGPDGKPFRTREGGVIKLESLLDEARDQIRPLVTSKWPNMSDHDIEQLSNNIGVAAIKYADLSHNLTTDYRFEWQKFLNPDGNTGPYLLYTVVRINSLLRTFEHEHGNVFLHDGQPLLLQENEELQVAKLIVGFADVLESVSDTLRPHLLCEYLYDLARAFNLLYGRHPIVRGKDALVMRSRLALSALTLRTLEIGLTCLNIPVVHHM